MSEIPEEIIHLLEKNYILARKLVAILRANGWRIATAESVTAGYVASFIASVPQASHCLRGGIVAYDTWSKAEFLGLPEELLRDTEGVSAEISRQMAEEARVKFSAHLGLSTTGFAGPTGREIGLVYIGVSTAKETIVDQRNLQVRFPSYQREGIRLHVSLEALLLALNTIVSMGNII